MPGLRILIPTTGPGTGPVLPTPLHAYGRTDASHRYVAERLTGAVDSLVNVWVDEIGTANYVTPSGATQTLTIKTEAGGFKSIAQPNATMTNAQTQRHDRPGVTGVRTIVQVVRFPNATVVGSRNAFRSMHQWRTFAGASNGQMGVAAASGSGVSGVVSSTSGEIGTGIEMMAASVNPSGGATQAKTSGGVIATGTLVLAAAATTDSIFGPDLSALDGRVLEHIESDVILTGTEMQTVMTALGTHYGA
jgi:hypothetical protein